MTSITRRACFTSTLALAVFLSLTLTLFLSSSCMLQVQATPIRRIARTSNPAPPAQQVNVNVKTTAVMKDPITNMLESKWVWVFFVFIILILVCVILYCFKDQVAVCVACIETCMYHTIKFLLFPFKMLLQCIRTVFYPLKQCWLATKDRCTRYLYPSEMRVAGLRY